MILSLAERKTINESFLFRGISEERMEALIDLVSPGPVSFDKGVLIRSSDDNTPMLGLILSGECQVEKRAGCSSLLMSRLNEGDVFGAASLFCESDVYVAAVTAIDRSRVLLMDAVSFSALLQRESVIMQNYIRYLTSRIRYLSERIDVLALGNNEDRLLLYLSNCSDKGMVSLDFGMEALANSLHMSRATLYRAFEKLENSGKIKKQGRFFYLYDYDKIK